MKQVFIGIFAHPDDESFGPSGTLALQIQNGAEVHLICATGGEHGQNPDAHDDLGDARVKEWYAAGALLGVKSQHHLGFIDGTLNNNQFKAIAKKTQDIIESILANYDESTEFTLITMDQNGISGHIDHITMSFVASYVFVNLRAEDARIKALWYFCVPDYVLPSVDTSFVFRSKGRAESEIDIRHDISTVFELKKQIMRAHISQRGDAEMLIARAEQAPKIEECFYTYKD
ncbi:MAG: PIG-L deacetylase family protein [Candidatus Saccharimonadales bacterium]